MTFLIAKDPLHLRRLRPSDLDEFVAYRNDPNVARYQGWEALTPDKALQFLTHMHSSPLLTPGEWTQVAVALHYDDTLVGDAGLFISQDGQEAEIGLTLAQAYQGKGFGTRGLDLALALIWRETQAATVRIWTDLRNIAALRVLRRANLVRLPDETRQDGGETIVEAAFMVTRP